MPNKFRDYTKSWCANCNAGYTLFNGSLSSFSPCTCKGDNTWVEEKKKGLKEDENLFVTRNDT